MDNERLFYEDLMLQNFSFGTFYNPTRYFMIYGMIVNGKFEESYEKQDIVNFIFDAYCYNKKIAEHHPQMEIRKVPNYGIKIFFQELEDALNEWKCDAKNNILTFDSKKIYVNLEDDGHIAEYVKKILDVLILKNFNTKFSYPNENDLILFDDGNLTTFGKSSYRNKVMADIQYCVICDDCNPENLYAVHILNSSKTKSIDELRDKNNGLIMCKKHADLFIKNQIIIDTRGKFVSEDDTLLEDSLSRLSMKIFACREKYLKRNFEISIKK